MNKYWKITVNTIGIISILSSLLMLFGLIEDWKFQADYFNFENSENQFFHLPTFYAFKEYHLLVIIGILLLWGGIELILKKKIGWVLSVISIVGLSFHIILLNLINYSDGLSESIKVDFLAYIITLIFGVLGLILLAKTVRRDYFINRRELFIVVITVLIVLIDTTFFNI